MAKASETPLITEYEREQIDAANASGKTPAVFVHGLWLLPSSWDRWRAVFEEVGFTTLSPGWPDDPNTVDEANRPPRRVRAQDRRPGRAALPGRDRRAEEEAGRASATRSAACSRRSSPGAACRPRRWRSIPRRSAACCRCRSRR